MKTVAIVNQKGGVGKSIIAYNFAHYLAERGQRVLFIDADEQGSSSKGKAMAPFTAAIDAAAMFGAEPITLPAPTTPITVLAGGPSLRAVEKTESDAALVRNLQARLAEVAASFDVCVVDTPGSNTKAPGAVLVSADFALIPCIVDDVSLAPTLTTLKRVVAIKRSYNQKLVNLGLLPNLFDAVAPAQRADLESLLRQTAALGGNLVIQAKLSKRSAYREAYAEGVPVWHLKKTSGRDAGKEIRAAFELISDAMEKAA